MKKTLLSIGSLSIFFAACYLVWGTFTAQQKAPATGPDHESNFKRDYNIYSLPTPTKLSFAGENVPLNILDVKERLDKELLVNTYWQSSTLMLLKRANRFFPIIEPILKKNGVPDDFKYLALIESGLENVVSPAGATGFWQILKGTATDYGLEVNGYVDERYNLEKATEFACQYLKDAKLKFGSWTMAAAAYNMGPNGLQNQLERQKTNNYYDLLLISETSRYVFRIIALKQILEHYDYYGFHIRPEDFYPPIQTVNVEVLTSIDDLADFAYQNKINYKILKLLNPWMRETKLPNASGKTYYIKLPKDASKVGLNVNKTPNFATDPLLKNVD